MAESAPLSEPSKRINEVEKVIMSEEQVQAETYEVKDRDMVVHQEDEEFEWREIVRGTYNGVAISND